MWFRKEQLQTVTWAGDPAKPMVGDDPLSCRRGARSRPGPRSCAAPRALVAAELALARPSVRALVDIIVQVTRCGC
jgi:two-component system, chemotaxis family, sensor kinase Cph1